jgi:hypothetical protein
MTFFPSGVHRFPTGKVTALVLQAATVVNVPSGS